MKSRTAPIAAAIALLLSAPAVRAADAPAVRMGLSGVGAGVFARNCAGCHTTRDSSGGDPRAPKLETLREYPPERIYEALTTGKMQVQGAALTDTDRREAAEWLSGRYIDAAAKGDASIMPNRCRGASALVRTSGWTGWSVDPHNDRFQSAKAAGLAASDLPRLKLKWAFGLPGAVQVFSQPSLFGGRVFIGSDSGQVYSLDAASGCVHWSFLAGAGVRTAPVVGTVRGAAGPVVFVGDMKAWLYALDARTGRLLWSAKVDDQPLARITGAPVLHQGRLYVPISTGEEGAARLPGYECCRNRGAVAAVGAADGRLVWKTYMLDPPQPTADAAGRRRWGPAGGAIWSSPTVDARRGRIYVTTGDAYAGPAGPLTDAVVALDLDTGKVAWAHQDTSGDVWVGGCVEGAVNCPEKLGPDWDFAASAMLKTLPGGRDLIIAGHKGGVALALDPDKAGALVWRTVLAAHPPGARGDIVFGGAADARSAYFALQESSALAALDLATGERRWTTPIVPPAGRTAPTGAGAAVTGLPGAILSGAWDGVLRAVSTTDGHPLWSFDTVRPFDTANKVPAKGGSMGGPGATVAGGMLFVGSGYVGVSSGTPGNVLLAFGL